MRQGRALSAEELAFLAEDLSVTVVPLVPMAEVALAGGSVGPLVPQVPAEVPAWLGLHLARRNQARLRAPEWLARERLEALLARERGLADEFCALPCAAFLETATLFLEHGRGSVAESERVRQLVEGVVECRKQKVLAGLASLTGPTTLIKMDNMTRLELNVLRPFLLKSLSQFDVVGGEEEPQQTE